jgi:hypothetical protein
MAVTVRFPSGQAVRYNEAKWVVWEGEGAAFYAGEDKKRFIARVLPGSGAIVEFQSPCDVSNPLVNREDMARLVVNSIREITNRTLLRELKCALQDFNATKYEWKKVE